MSARLELYVTRSDGSSYCEADGRDDPQTRRDLDRQAIRALARADVISVEFEVVEGRTGGYRR